MTNKEKFKEVFGFTVNNKMMCPVNLNCDSIRCKDCPFNADWWDKEYKNCFRIKEVKNEKQQSKS